MPHRRNRPIWVAHGGGLPQKLLYEFCGGEILARDSKLEVAAINIRIPSDAQRDYIGLVIKLASLKRGAKVYGDTVIAIESFDEPSRTGTFAKFTEIDFQGDWFNIDSFSRASSSEKNDIHIPEKLRPNYSAFYFKINEPLHTIAFECYSESRGLSPNLVERYFREALSWTEITSAFGIVQADIVKDYDGVEALLSLPNLKEIKFIIRRPNSDEIDKTLRAVIEERLSDQNADEFEEIIRTHDRSAITPNARSVELAAIAAENGSVHVKNVQNGIVVPHSTDEIPLKEVIKHKPDATSGRVLFLRLAGDILEKIRSRRSQQREAN